MTLTKSEIIDSVQEETGLPRKRCDELVEDLLELIKGTLESGEDLMISGFGKFCVKQKNQRKGRNPATGEDLMLNSRRVITFKCSQSLRERINSH
ncbi:MAG: integration host factor subunit alpha [Thermodesulfobacteriota bacterium]